MVKNIDPKLRKIGNYLKLEDAIFKIPEYQRAYSWDISNCDKLWQDIVEFAETESKEGYFFGTIIISCQENDTEFVLIDGQQRTTTFLLLLKALLIRINEAITKTDKDEDSEKLCRGLKEHRRNIMEILYKAETEDVEDYPSPPKDREICKQTLLLENCSMNELFKKELKTILEAVSYDEIEASVEKIPYKQKDNKYTKFFKNFKFFYEKIKDLEASQLNKITKVFTNKCEVIEIKSWDTDQAIAMFNSLNSDGMPLCDSDIISAKLYAFALKEGKGELFNQLWKSLLEQLKDMNIVSIDSILMQQMYYTRAVEKDILTDSNSINVTTPGVRRYFTEVNHNILKDPIDLCNKMINLTKIWQKIIQYPIAQILLKFNDNSKLFLASYFYRYRDDNIPEDKVEIILKCMLRLFVILELVDTGYSSSNFKTFLFGEEIKLVDATITEEEIKNDFDNHIRNKWKRADIEKEIKDYDKNILVYLNEYLFAKEQKMEFKIGPKCDIEHIMPNSGRNIPEIRKNAGIGDEAEFISIVNKLGNKILLEEKINRSISDTYFSSKISTKLEDKTGYIDSSYPIAKKLVSTYKDVYKPYWTKTDIENKTDSAATRITNFIFDEESNNE